MEQTIMVLVFALAAALCLRVFVWSDLHSLRNEARDQALLQAENTAELLKGDRGDMADRLSDAAQQLGGSYEQGILWVDYDEDWSPVSTDGASYRLTAQGVPSSTPGLAMAQIQVVSDDGTDQDVLFSLEIAWQEVQ
jgi:hypothetical protein